MLQKHWHRKQAEGGRFLKTSGEGTPLPHCLHQVTRTQWKKLRSIPLLPLLFSPLLLPLVFQRSSSSARYCLLIRFIGSQRASSVMTASQAPSRQCTESAPKTTDTLPLYTHSSFPQPPPSRLSKHGSSRFYSTVLHPYLQGYEDSLWSARVVTIAASPTPVVLLVAHQDPHCCSGQCTRPP